MEKVGSQTTFLSEVHLPLFLHGLALHGFGLSVVDVVGEDVLLTIVVVDTDVGDEKGFEVVWRGSKDVE